MPARLREFRLKEWLSETDSEDGRIRTIQAIYRYGKAKRTWLSEHELSVMPAFIEEAELRKVVFA
jgi:hypothetical protein